MLQQNVLIVCALVKPKVGGMEEFVDLLQKHVPERTSVKVISSDFKNAQADIVVPTYFMGAWPIPTGGIIKLWKAIKWSDGVVLNGQRHILPSVAAIMAKMQRKPAVFLIHTASDVLAGSIAYKTITLLFDRLVSPIVLRTTRVTSLSVAGQRYVKRKWKLEAGLLPIPISVPAQKTIEGVNHPVIVWTGRLAPEKAPMDAVAVGDALHKQGRKIELHMVGGGMYEPDLREAASTRPWLKILGAQSKDIALAHQQRATLCLSTSVEEASQLALLEPLAMGKVCVCTNVGDASYHLGESLKELACTPGDIEQITHRITQVLDNGDLWNDKIAVNAERLRKQHEPHTVTQKLFNSLVK